MLRLELVVCQPFSPVPHHLLPHPVDLLLHLQLLEHRTEQEEVNVGLLKDSFSLPERVRNDEDHDKKADE